MQIAIVIGVLLAVWALSSQPAAASVVSSAAGDIESLIGGGMDQQTLSNFAQAIAQQEGYGVFGARPTRNNNPGDLRPPSGAAGYWSGQVGVDGGGFAIFATVDDGWAALETDLRTHAERNPGQTLAQFIASYAPSSDGNDPAGYAQAVASALGVSPDTTLGGL